MVFNGGADSCLHLRCWFAWAFTKKLGLKPRHSRRLCALLIIKAG